MTLADLSLGELRDLADDMVLVAAASEAGIFEALGAGPRSGEDVARALGYDERATLVLLRALESAGLLTNDGERFCPTERCMRELCDPAVPGYRGRGLPHWLRGLRARTQVGEVLRRGGPLEPHPKRRDPEHVARFTAAMAAAPAERIERIVTLCLARLPRAASVLDLGGGTGHLIRGFLGRGLTGTFVDTPDIVAHVREAYGLDAVPGLDVVPGDVTRDVLPPGPFDIVVMSNVIHIFGPAVLEKLFANATAVLAPGGMLAVVESLRGRSRRAGYIGMQMLLKSDEGGAYSASEVEGWMMSAGLEKCVVTDVDDIRQLVTGVLPSR